MTDFLHIRSKQFPILNGEEDELINPGTYGKSFAIFLQEQLSQQGYSCPLVCCEDWGWWLEVELSELSIGVCCYRQDTNDLDCEFACTPSVQSNRVWSWRRFRKIDIGDEVAKLVEDTEKVFQFDPGIEFLGRSAEYPL